MGQPCLASTPVSFQTLTCTSSGVHPAEAVVSRTAAKAMNIAMEASTSAKAHWNPGPPRLRSAPEHGCQPATFGVAAARPHGW